MQRKTFYHSRNNERGQVVLIAVLTALFVGMVIVIGAGIPALRDAQTARELFSSKQALAMAESGEEDAFYRIKKALPHQSPIVITLDSHIATTSIADNLDTGLREVRATGTAGLLLTSYRKKKLDLVRGDDVTFNYGVQSGSGGLTLANSSSIVGNVYSNGSVSGDGNYIYGTVVSAGESGLINNIHATGTVKAHSIQNSVVDKDAYYGCDSCISNTTVGGESYSDSADPPPKSFAISDDIIDGWEIAAESGTIVNCSGTREIRNTEVTIGPTKYTCNLTIKGSTVTLAGPVWATGNIYFDTGSIIRVATTSGRKSEVMIADLPSDRTTSSKIIIGQTTTFQNSGTNGSYVGLISRNRSAEDGGSVKAIDLGQSATGDVLLYTNHGLVSIGQSSNLKEVTGYKIELANSAQVVYQTGVADPIFDTGPGGTWNIYDWRERQ